MLSPLGSSLTPRQTGLLARFREVLVLFDGDKAGRHGAREVAAILSSRSWVRVADMPEESDPASLEPGDLDRLLRDVGFPHRT